MKSARLAGIGVLALTAVIVGCSSQTTTKTAKAPRQPNSEGVKYLLSASPAGAQDVIAVREEAANDQEVVVIGRIGGSESPWIEGRAAFSVVDRSLKACSDIPGDMCPTPWDYCCEAGKASATTFVKFVDDHGDLLATDARELLGLEELQTVVVKGKAHRDEAGNVTILANGIYVDPSSANAHHNHGGGEHEHDHAHSHDHEHANHEHGHDEDHGHHHEGHDGDGHDPDHAEHHHHEDSDHHPHGDRDGHDADAKSGHEGDHDHPKSTANENHES